MPALRAFRHTIERLWVRTLRRRSQKDRFAWDRITKPKILHPWPQQRFAVRHSR
jgi:RNA-directed DNA polymerase